MNAVMTLCDNAILLDHGKVISYGIPRSIVDAYISRICIQSHKGEKPLNLVDARDTLNNHSNISTHEIEFDSIRILNPSKNVITHAYYDDEITISFSFRSLRHIEDPAFGILIRNRYGMSIFGTNTHLLHQKNNPLLPGKIYRVSYRLKVPLQPDDYLITVAIDNAGKATNSFDEYLLRLNDIATLKVVRNEKQPLYEGVTNLNPTINVEAITNGIPGGVLNE
jgi:lipopolysaccharide transport system ATP-binding protein